MHDKESNSTAIAAMSLSLFGCFIMGFGFLALKTEVVTPHSGQAIEFMPSVSDEI